MRNSIFFKLSAIWLFFFGYLYALPLKPLAIGDNIDAAWQNTNAYAFVHSWQFGKDIIFTSGPLSFVYARLYYPGTLGLNFLITLLVQTAFSWNFLAYAKRLNAPPVLAAAVGTLFFACVNFPSDTYYYALILLTFVIPQNWVRSTGTSEVDRDDLLQEIVAALALALVSLMKVSFCTVIITLCLFSFARKLYQRKFPRFELSILFFFLVVWILSGQQLVNLPAYGRASYEISKYYVSSMLIHGNNSELTYFLLGAATICFGLYQSERTKFKTLLCAILLYFLIKASFVRQDDHTVIAGSFLIGCMFLSFFYWRKYTWRAVLMTLAFILFSYQVCAHSVTGQPEYIFNLVKEQTGTRLENLIQFPQALTHWNDLFQAQTKLFRQKYPLDLTRKTDAVSIRQSNVIAYGDIYQSRPVIQSYSAYSPYLIEQNEKFFLDRPNPPDILYFSEPIDNRLASLDEPYLFSEIGNKVTVLRHSLEETILRIAPEKPRRKFVLAFTKTLRDQETLALPADFCNEPLWAKVEIPKNFLQMFEEFLYKVPYFYITLDLRAGGSVERRFIPGMGAYGFLISPYAESVTDLDADHFLNSEKNCQNGVKVVSFRSKYSPLGLKSIYQVSIYKIKPAQ